MESEFINFRSSIFAPPRNAATTFQKFGELFNRVNAAKEENLTSHQQQQCYFHYFPPRSIYAPAIEWVAPISKD